MPSNSMHVINFNRNQLPKRDKFKNKSVTYSIGNKQEYDFPKATNKYLKSIGKRLKSERKNRMNKVVCLTVFLFIVLIYVLRYIGEGAIGLVTY